MYFVGNFVLAVAKVLDLFLTLFMWAIIIRTLLTWVNPDPLNPVVKFIYKITNPTIKLVNSIIPTAYMGIDFAPIIIFLCITFLRTFLVNSLTQTAMIFL